MRTAGQRLPYLCPTSSKSTLQDVQEEWEESPKREAVAEADDVLPSTSPAPSGEADARRSAAPMAAVPWPKELPPACMPEDGKSSASPLAADPVLEARTAPLTPSACEEEEAAPSPLAGGLLQEVSKVYLPRPTVMEATEPCLEAPHHLSIWPGASGPGAWSNSGPQGCGFLFPCRFPPSTEAVHSVPHTSKQCQRKSQVCPKVWSHPSPRHGGWQHSTHRVGPCPTVPSPRESLGGGGRQDHAQCLPSPSRTAL